MHKSVFNPKINKYWGLGEYEEVGVGRASDEELSLV